MKKGFVSPAAAISTKLTRKGSVSFPKNTGKTFAHIDYAAVSGLWTAEPRYSFGTGRYQSAQTPVSTYGKKFPSREEAVADAATRLIEGIEFNCGNDRTQPVSQKREVEQIIAWAQTLIASAKPQSSRKPLEGLRVLDCCAGIGGFHLGLAEQGAEVVAAVEINEESRKVYAANFPDVELFEDITEKGLVDKLPDFDVLTGGFPCQSFSTAGLREGFEAKTKGGIFYDILKLAKLRKPKLIFLENVEGFCTIDGGAAKSRAMDEIAKLGYQVSMMVLNAAEFGLAQQRMRVFFCCTRIDVWHQAGGKPFLFPVGSKPSVVVNDILDKNETGWQCKPEDVFTVEKNPEIDFGFQNKDDTTKPIHVGRLKNSTRQGSRILSARGIGLTLCAFSGGFGQTNAFEIEMHDGSRIYRGLNERETARMQGFPEGFVLHPHARTCREQMGNAVAVPCVSAIAAAAGKYVEAFLPDPTTAGSGGGSKPHPFLKLVGGRRSKKADEVIVTSY